MTSYAPWRQFRYTFIPCSLSSDSISKRRIRAKNAAVCRETGQKKCENDFLRLTKDHTMFVRIKVLVRIVVQRFLFSCGKCKRKAEQKGHFFPINVYFLFSRVFFLIFTNVIQSAWMNETKVSPISLWILFLSLSFSLDNFFLVFLFTRCEEKFTHSNKIYTNHGLTVQVSRA